MNKPLQRAMCLTLFAVLMSGCSMNQKKEVSQNSEEIGKTAERSVDEAKDMSEDSIDNVMNFFKEQGLAFENAKEIKDMEFAAKEGRSFEYEGNTAYLYRINTEDENMKRVLQEAKDSGKVKVNIDNKEQEYGAKVNGDYLFLYNADENWDTYVQAFPNYSYGNGVSEPSNPGTTNNAKEQNNTETPSNTTKETKD